MTAETPPPEAPPASAASAGSSAPSAQGAAPPPRRRRRRWLRIAAAVIAGLVVAGYALRGTLLPAAGWWLVAADPPQPVDAVMVLGGGATTRPFGAAAMVRVGLTRRVLISTVRPPPDEADGDVPPEHEYTRRALVGSGVPDSAVIRLDPVVAGTFDEAASLAAWMDEHPDAVVGIVTNDFHTRRAGRVFRHVLGSRADRLRVFAVPTDGFGPDNWWRFEEGVSLYLNEFAKTAYYEVRYR